MSLVSKLEDYCFRIYRIIGRTVIKYSNNPRPASLPFITGDGFRKLAKHVFDKTNPAVDPKSVAAGDIVFVGDSQIEQFLSDIHPHISHPYVLITHNGDATVNEAVFEKAKDKIIKWYGINVTHTDPKIVPLPLGIENQHYFVCGIPAVFKIIMRRSAPRKDKIFYGFTVSTNPAERQPALDVVSKHPDGESLRSLRGFYFYLAHMRNYKLVLSPPGSSVEGHRNWDTLYIGSVPIVKKSITTDYFKKIGVPLLVIENWNDLATINSATISTLYTETKAASDPETLTMDYWVKKIKHHQP